jgi:hypothetical protein
MFAHIHDDPLIIDGYDLPYKSDCWMLLVVKILLRSHYDLHFLSRIPIFDDKTTISNGHCYTQFIAKPPCQNSTLNPY